MTLIQKPDHVRRQAGQAEACLRPQLGRREARERKLPLGIKGVVEIEDQNQVQHRQASRGCRVSKRCQTASANKTAANA